MMIAFIPGLPGGSEWIIILIIALLIFGKRLPEVMRSMGQSIKQFKKGMDDIDIGAESDHENSTENPDTPPPEEEQGSEDKASPQ